MPYWSFDMGSEDRGWTQEAFVGFNRGENYDDVRNIYFDRVVEFDEHLVASSGDYTLTQATAGTFAHDATVANIGVWLLDCNSSTVTQGGNLQFDKLIGACSASSIVAFETRLKVADIATGPEFFAGLSATDTSIIATSAITTGDKIGWWSVTDDNVVLFGAGNSAVPTASSTTAHTLVEDTYVKLAMRIERASVVKMWVDGIKVANSVAAATIPDGLLLPSFVCQSNGTTDPIVHLDRFRYAVMGA